jgi:hypothetical protein
LQYACTFPLAPTRDCASTTGDCACSGDAGASPDSPLCQNPDTGTYGTTQFADGAFPGLRYLEVLREYGTNSLLASACPKITDPTLPGHGYAPAFDALVDQMAWHFIDSGCLSRRLQTGKHGFVGCRFVEATRPELDVHCDTLGRSPVAAEIIHVARKQLQQLGRCSSGDGPANCSQMRLCMLEPADDQELCRNAADDELGDAPLGGYCYIDATQDLDGDGAVNCTALGDPDCLGNPELVSECTPTRRRRLRFVSQGIEPPVPHPQADVFVACGAVP